MKGYEEVREIIEVARRVLGLDFILGAVEEREKEIIFNLDWRMTDKETKEVRILEKSIMKIRINKETARS